MRRAIWSFVLPVMRMIFYDEIGCGLKIRELQRTKEELLRALEMYYKVLYIGMDESEM